MQPTKDRGVVAVVGATVGAVDLPVHFFLTVRSIGPTAARGILLEVPG